MWVGARPHAPVGVAARGFGRRWLLPLLGVLSHFGCWGGLCPWPFHRQPPWSPSAAKLPLALALPETGSFAILLLYYATIPALLPRGFPRARCGRHLHRHRDLHHHHLHFLHHLHPHLLLLQS